MKYIPIDTTHSKFVDITGKRFNSLVAIKLLGKRRNPGKVYWLCRCDCGGMSEVRAESLKKGQIKTCGCSQASHGRSATLLHKIWTTMKQRCFNSNDRKYPSYGGRGITVCPEWANDFTAFAEYMGPRPSKEHSIDRIDNDGNYEPGNVRWATRRQQQSNTRRNYFFQFQGKPYTVTQLARKTGVNEGTLRRRLKKLGMSVEDAVSKEPLKPGRKFKRPQ